MNKPNGYDDARTMGEFNPIELGGHYAVIKQVVERKTNDGAKEMVVALVDFCDPDKQPNYFADQFGRDDRPDKKWPFAGTKYVMIQDYNDPSKTSSAFKTFCTSYEKSNNCAISWGGANWGAQFKNKRIGVVYGEEEHEYEGRRSMRRVLKRFCSWDSVPDVKIPKAKMLSAPLPSAGSATTSTGFLDIPDDADSMEIPF